MSYVSTVVVMCAGCERLYTGDTLERLNKLLASAESTPEWPDKAMPEFREVSAAAGGNKVPETNIYVAGVNYFEADRFVALVLAEKWEYPGQLVIVVAMEDESYPARIFRSDGEVVR